MREYEADDALATATRRFASEVDQVRILTPDKDLTQCLFGDRVVLVDRMRHKAIDESAFRNARGFPPASMPDFLALTGDSADGIPGLPGFGEKSATSHTIGLDVGRTT
jgi:5'-3' exonuclease